MTIAPELKSSVECHQDAIRSIEEPACYMCGGSGKTIYSDLSDRAFDAPGTWTIRKCVNGNCGLLWLDPVPVPEDNWKAYRTYYTHPEHASGQGKSGVMRRLFRAYIARMRAAYLNRRYGYSIGGRSQADRPLAWLARLLPWRIAEWDMSVMFLHQREAGRSLELGCGGGDLLRGFSELGWDAEGVDVDPNAIQNARMKGLNVRLGTVEELSYPSDSFDAVLMVHVFEHVCDPRRLLRECHRILKPGGQLALVTPNADSFLHRMYGESWFALEPPRHLHMFTIAAIKKLLNECGFSGADPFTTIRDADGLVAASRSIRDTGHFTMGSAQPRWVRVYARGVQVCEWLLKIVDPSAGEELTVVVRK